MKKQRGKASMWTPKKIKDLRNRLGESQDEFARRFRVTVDAVQHWEQGRGLPSGPVSVILDRIEQDMEIGKLQAAQPA